MVDIKFIEESHEYFVNGSRWPSVTQIVDQLNDFSMVPKDVLKAASSFGKHVHTMCELYDQDNLQEDMLDKDLVPWLDGWKRFLSETGFQITHNETIIVSEKYRYAGKLDRAGIINNKLAIIDIKTPTIVPRSTGPQTAAYEQAFKETTWETPKQRFAVQLFPGGYKMVPFKDKNDFNIFMACLSIHNWRNNK